MPNTFHLAKLKLYPLCLAANYLTSVEHEPNSIVVVWGKLNDFKSNYPKMTIGFLGANFVGDPEFHL